MIDYPIYEDFVDVIEIHDVDWYNDHDTETQAAMNLADTKRFIDEYKKIHSLSQDDNQNQE